MLITIENTLLTNNTDIPEMVASLFKENAKGNFNILNGGYDYYGDFLLNNILSLPEDLEKSFQENGNSFKKIYEKLYDLSLKEMSHKGYEKLYELSLKEMSYEGDKLVYLYKDYIPYSFYAHHNLIIEEKKVPDIVFFLYKEDYKLDENNPLSLLSESNIKDIDNRYNEILKKSSANIISLNVSSDIFNNKENLAKEIYRAIINHPKWISANFIKLFNL